MNKKRERGTCIECKNNRRNVSYKFFFHTFKTTTQKMCVHFLCLLYRSHIHCIVHSVNSSSHLSLTNFYIYIVLFIHASIFATLIVSYIKSIPFFSCFLTPCVAVVNFCGQAYRSTKKKLEMTFVACICKYKRERGRERGRAFLCFGRTM
jgi:hypothetical protein